jgi:hypothetical protein
LGTLVNLNPDNPALGNNTHFSRGDRTGACDVHDRCYQTCYTGSLPVAAIKATCDTQFCIDLKQTCDDAASAIPRDLPDVIDRCYHFAETYCNNVIERGPYSQSQKDFCNCCHK